MNQDGMGSAIKSFEQRENTIKRESENNFTARGFSYVL